MNLPFVNYEHAQILKKLGFPQEYSHGYYYTNEGSDYPNYIASTADAPTLIQDMCYCPTVNLATKWIRETYDVRILPFNRELPNGKYSHFYDLDIIIPQSNDPLILVKWNSDEHRYVTYEDALQQGLTIVFDNGLITASSGTTLTTQEKRAYKIRHIPTGYFVQPYSSQYQSHLSKKGKLYEGDAMWRRIQNGSEYLRLNISDKTTLYANVAERFPNNVTKNWDGRYRVTFYTNKTDFEQVFI